MGAALRVLDDSLAESAEYGQKARGLARLRRKGFAVPDAFVIAGDEAVDEESIWARVQAWIPGAINQRGMAALAVRSSSAAEDDMDRSLAGQFASALGAFGPGELMHAIKQVQASGGPQWLPVIVQAAVDPDISGVAFSCDPVSFDREPYLVSWVQGTSTDHVAGREDGSLLAARSADDYDGKWPFDQAALEQLLSVLEVMQAELGRPADIEWAIDKAGKLWLLQARPVVLPKARRVDANSGSDLALLPGVVAGHSKIRLRAAAYRAKVQMSNAAIVTTSDHVPADEVPKWIASPDAAGLSIVLLHPCHASNKVQREFAQVGGFDVPFFTHGCRRYAIRRYPSRESAATATSDVLSRGLEQSWLASVIIQEIYDATATGIVRRLGGEYVAELAIGHFVPKGVVDPARFIITAEGEVLESRRVVQDIAYRFINGHVVTELPVEEPLELQLSDEEVAEAVLQVVPLFDEYPDAALEFGVMKDRKGAVKGYVIDMAESDSQSAADKLDLRLIHNGVLSPGRAEGVAVRVLNAGDTELDTHLLEQFDEAGGPVDDVVLIADRASVDLLPLVSRCGSNTAFVFRRASLLAHLSIVLRERGIPAIVLEDDDLFGKLTSGLTLTVEASDAHWIGPRVT